MHASGQTHGVLLLSRPYECLQDQNRLSGTIPSFETANNLGFVDAGHNGCVVHVNVHAL